MRCLVLALSTSAVPVSGAASASVEATSRTPASGAAAAPAMVIPVGTDVAAYLCCVTTQCSGHICHT